jgi:hypothetical protein
MGIPEPRWIPDPDWVWGYTFYPRSKLGLVWGNSNYMDLGLGRAKPVPAPTCCHA